MGVLQNSTPVFCKHSPREEFTIYTLFFSGACVKI
ncbi:hypothetical protein EVA_10648 [gut metagenome]|uniref:Uncharacterized protein n=1 Tax=gut metagenome TaxID=749906 RepID=J9CMC1_9ZZZZ